MCHVNGVRSQEEFKIHDPTLDLNIKHNLKKLSLNILTFLRDHDYLHQILNIWKNQ